MGMYPGATLSYGIEVPDTVYWDELPWYTQEALEEFGDSEYLAENILEKAGLGAVGLISFGHMGYGETGTILATKSMRFYAYDVCKLEASELEIPEGDAELLGQAWALLFPNEEANAPSWVISLSYG